MPPKTKQLDKGVVMSSEKDGSKPTRISWASIKRTLNKDTIAKIASIVDVQKLPSNPIYHPAVQGLRRDLRTMETASMASGPYQKQFFIQHANRDYTVDIMIRENNVTFITFKGIPDAQGSAVIKPKILSTFSHSLFMTPNGMEYVTNIEVNKTMCSDDQERVFYAVIAILLSSKRLFDKELARLDAVKVRLIGIQRPIISLRDRVRELFQA